MHIKTTMGRGLEICAERNRNQYTDWTLSVSKPTSINGIEIGILRFFEGKIKLQYPIEAFEISKHVYIKTDVGPDLLKSSVRRLAKMISAFLDVEFVMES